jgi:hypothetical protein
MGLCKDCRYWNRRDAGPLAIMWGYCDAASQSLIKERTQTLSRAYATNLRRDDSELLTGADFGCVQFEEKS